ncbi:hypothetical protein [Synechococcus sp. UW140]|uniref:hypothetical protein n=1 Tax=Synechococcus sp. UW140 TaxID=368503 RepID=UPI0025E7C989|nr:hypothetical protein [Synechococcus sp. UW140]
MAQALANAEARSSQSATVLMFPTRLQPGCFVKLLQHPHDLPPFEMIHCNGRSCWVRQQAWGPAVYWKISRLKLTHNVS